MLNNSITKYFTPLKKAFFAASAAQSKRTQQTSGNDAGGRSAHLLYNGIVKKTGCGFAQPLCS